MSSRSKIRENAVHRLVVEGKDDQYAIINLMSKHGWDWNHPAPALPFVHDAGGIEEVLRALSVDIQARPRTGFVVDVDLSLPDRWSAICGQLTKAGIDAPASPSPGGTIINHGEGKRLGFWLMPDNHSQGNLEDFLARLVPAGDPSWPWAQTAAASARADHAAPFADKDRSKAAIHTWLAWREQPGQPFGTAVTVASFAHDAPLAAAFVGWMNRLFVDP